MNSQFPVCFRSLNHFYVADCPEKFKKLLYVILWKLVALKHIASTNADSMKNEYSNFLHTAVKKNMPSF